MGLYNIAESLLWCSNMGIYTRKLRDIGGVYFVTSDAGLIIFFPLRYFTPVAATVLDMKILNMIVGGNLSPPNLYIQKLMEKYKKTVCATNSYSAHC